MATRNPLAWLTWRRACHRRRASPRSRRFSGARPRGTGFLTGREEPMFAVVRTGGKQYRVAPGDKIVVEKLDGNAGDRVTLGDVLLAGDGGSLKSTDGLTAPPGTVPKPKGAKGRG